MKKKLKKWGANLGVLFTKDEIELYELKEGLWLDLRDMVVMKKPKIRNRGRK